MNLRWGRGAALGAALMVTLAACGGGGADQGAAPSDVAGALEQGGAITVWSWGPTMEAVVAGFEAKHPNVAVELVNAGTGNDQYTALQNAITAGSGVPDVAHVEYYAVSQFALSEGLTDLNTFGASDLQDRFTTGPWNGVSVDEGVYGLPMDSGPMALFYNKEVFDRYGVTPPTTWAEYLTAARALHAADPNVYITSDTGDAGLTTSLLWQAGAQPYVVDGTDVKIDFTDPGVAEFAAIWQQLIDEKLLSPVSAWGDEWYKGLGDGTIASLATGAWMPANLESSVPSGAGKWRVAPLPQWQAGAETSAENGGSSLAVPAASTNKELAYAFVEYSTVGEGVAIQLAEKVFPATVADLESAAFTGAPSDYFGGQKINEVLAESARNVVPGWQYLPYQVYANSVFNDTVGQAYVSGTPITEGLKNWQDVSMKYGQEQGFTVHD